MQLEAAQGALARDWHGVRRIVGDGRWCNRSRTLFRNVRKVFECAVGGISVELNDEVIRRSVGALLAPHPDRLPDSG